MTGAGSAELAFALTDGLFGSLVDEDSDGNAEYYEPGRDPTIQELSLDRALARQRKPNSVWSSDSVAGNLEGAFGLQCAMDATTQSHLESTIFNATSPVTLAPGRTATSQWFIGLDYLNGTAERALLGVTPLDYSVEYTQGGQILITATYAYGDEEYNTSITPSSIVEADDSTAMFHGFDLDINGTVQTKEQSATLSISNISQYQRGSEKRPIDAVTGPVEAQLDLTAIFSETDQLEAAYGGVGQTSTSKRMDDVPGSMELSAAGGPVSTYEFAKLKPNNYSWEEVLSGENTTETTQFNVDGEPAVTVA